MGSIADLYASVRADMSEFDSDLQKGLTKSADKSAKTFGQRFKSKINAANVGTAVGAAMGGVAVGALKLADEYKSAIDTIRIGTGATGEALADLEGSFQRVAGEVPDDIGLVSQVIADLNTRTGATGEGLEHLAKQILDLSRLTGGDPAANVASLTRLFGDWSIATEDQSDSLDKVFRAAQATGIGVDQLSQAMVQFGAPLRNIGFSFEEAAAMLGKWEKEGVNTTLALGGLKIALGEFAKQGIDAKDGLADLVDQIVNADTAAEAMAIGVKKFGSRAGPDMVAAIREGRFAIDDYVDIVENGSDTIVQATSDTQDFGDQFKKLKNQVAVAVGPIVKDFAGIGEALGNAIFLLPVLGGVIGRGLGKALSSTAVKGVITRAGGAAGLAYGAAFAAAAAVIAIELQELLKVQEGIAEERRKLDEATRRQQAGEFSVGQLRQQLADLRAAREQMKAEGFFEGPIGNAIFDQTAGKEFEAREKATVAAIQQMMLAQQRAIEHGTPAVVEAAAETGEQVGTAMVQATVASGVGLGEAMSDLTSGFSGIATRAVDRAIARANQLVDAMSLVAARGVKGLKAQERDADKAWKNILGAGDGNKRRLRQVNADIDKWERRLRKAIRNNDSEGYAYAQAELARLEDEKQSRKLVRQEVQRLHDEVTGLPRKRTVDIAVRMNFSMGSLGGSIADVIALAENAVDKAGKNHRAAGGPVSSHTPYIVGELGPEMFVPSTAGRIEPNHKLGGDTYNISPTITGLPSRRRTPREVVAELGRATRIGTLSARPARGFDPA